MFSRSRSAERVETTSDEATRKRGRQGLDYRPDIEGLRAFALFFALGAHAGIPAIRGGYIGLDIFFVISGFLITRLLLTEMEKRGTLSTLNFYGHRAKRILPQAALVLTVTAILSAIMLSPVRSDVVAGDILAATFYVVNWHFAGQSVDYFAADVAGSPVLHFWSLAIEEQFYIVWPALMLGVTWWFRRRGLGVRPILGIVVSITAVISLIYSIRYTAEVPSAAYYSTFTRIWEIMVGAGIALIPFSFWKIPKPAAWTLGMAGLVTIVGYCLIFDDAALFPGYLAAIPVAATAAVIIAGMPERRLPLANRFLGSDPMAYIGRLSYAWYLWHWPMLVLAEASWGPLNLDQRIGIVALSAMPAVATHHLFEIPLRYSQTMRGQPKRALALGFACSAVAIIGSTALIVSRPQLPTIPAGSVKGAFVLDERPNARQPQRKADAVAPNPIDADKDKSAMWDRGCQIDPLETDVFGPDECVFGEPDSRTTVVLIGDSHALHWFPALNAVAEKRDWRLLARTKVGCPPYLTLVYNRKLDREYTECRTWLDSVLEQIEEVKPQMVVTSGFIRHKAMVDGEWLSLEESQAETEDAYVRTLERIRGTGAQSVVLRDTPKAPYDIPECVADNLDNLRECAFEPPSRAERDNMDERAAARVTGVHLVNMQPSICPEGVCPAVMGDALVWRDDNHLSATFSRTLGRRLDKQLPRPN